MEGEGREWKGMEGEAELGLHARISGPFPSLPGGKEKGLHARLSGDLCPRLSNGGGERGKGREKGKKGEIAKSRGIIVYKFYTITLVSFLFVAIVFFVNQKKAKVLRVTKN